MVSHLSTAQTRSSDIIRALSDSLKDESSASLLLEETEVYLEDELKCVGFLEERAAKNKQEANRIASTLQNTGRGDDSLQQLSKLRRSVANDMEAASALRRFAQEIEELCSSMLTKDVVEAEKERVVRIYVLFFKLHLKKTLPDELFELIRVPFQEAIPKPAPVVKPAKVEKPVVKEEKKEEPKAPKPAMKWGTIKKQEVKGIDEINKELESSRVWYCLFGETSSVQQTRDMIQYYITTQQSSPYP